MIQSIPHNSNKGKRLYQFSVMSYLNEEVIKSILPSHDIIECHYIYHDKDIDCVPHFHIIFVTVNAHTISAVEDWFSGYYDSDGVHINSFVQECHNFSSACRYLIHLDDKDKYPYDIESVCHFGERSRFRKAFENGSEYDTATLALNAFVDGKPLLEIARTYGRDFIYHYNSFRSLYQDIREDYIK